MSDGSRISGYVIEPTIDYTDFVDSLKGRAMSDAEIGLAPERDFRERIMDDAMSVIRTYGKTIADQSARIEALTAELAEARKLLERALYRADYEFPNDIHSFLARSTGPAADHRPR